MLVGRGCELEKGCEGERLILLKLIGGSTPSPWSSREKTSAEAHIGRKRGSAAPLLLDYLLSGKREQKNRHVRVRGAENMGREWVKGEELHGP